MSSETAHLMHDFRSKWRIGFPTKPLLQLEQERQFWEELIVEIGKADPAYHRTLFKDDLAILEDYDGRIHTLRERLIKMGEKENPMAFCLPTYHQAQFLNAWSPEFDPDKAPNGYQTVVNFGGKRSGKSFAAILDAILWMIPNNDEWPIFQEQIDPRHGPYRVLRRPMFDFWQRKGKMIYDRDEPPVQGRTIWHGCVDEDHYKNKIDPVYRRQMPMQYVKRNLDGKTYVWNISDRYFETTWGTRLTGKLYKSDIQAWGGDEIFMVLFDEGPPRAVLDEVVARSLRINWAYTPAEAANTKDRVQVAREVWDGKIELVGATHVMRTSMRDIPDRITPKSVLDARIKTLETRGEEGRVALDGGFFDSSPRVFDLFVRERHVLPITGEQVSRAILGKWTPEELMRFPWLTKFEDANIIRGYDEGFVHRATCTWIALLKSGEQVAFRLFGRSAASIKDRCEAIVALSGNRLKEVRHLFDRKEVEEMEIALTYAPALAADREREKHTNERIVRFREVEDTEIIRETYGDSKLFKRDPKYLMDTWGQEYARNGLRLRRASTRLPEERCTYTNGLFRANPSRQHLNPDQASVEYPYGYDLYLVCDCHDRANPKSDLIERLEHYLWEAISAGVRKGEFTGKPDKDGDDEIDSLCYATNHKTRWIPNAEICDRRRGVMEEAA